MKRNQLVPDFVNNVSNGFQHSNRNCTMSVHVGGVVNMLASNKENSMIVVAGRTILKLYSVEDNCFSEKINMRVGRRQGLNLSCADVAWNHIHENYIATAATNGAIVMWDLNTPSRNKQMGIFNDHKRTVTKICFHGSEPDRLLSGSQDCTMKIFDVRKKECVATFASKTDGVRCVQFCPHEYFQFAASFDNGSVQVWDYRNTSTYMKQFIAHKGSVYTIDWHPDIKDKQLIATGGRDYKVKIWDMADHKMHPHTVIPTHSLVAVTRWRPQRREQIASAAMMLDHSINVWDIRRPYVPFANFIEHTDVTTGIVWKKSDPDILFSCSKDGTLFQHSMKDAHRPSEHCNLSGLALGSRGHLGHACTDSLDFRDSMPNPKNKGIGRFGFRSVVGVASAVTQTRSDANLWLQHNFSAGATGGKLAKFLNSKSDLNIHCERTSLDDPVGISSTSLICAAKQYKLQGLPFDELCYHNAQVAQNLGMSRDSNIWMFLKVFFDDAVCSDAERRNSGPFPFGSVEKGTQKTSRENAKNNLESNGEESEQHSDPETEHYLTDIAKGHATSEQDCFYSEDEDFSDSDFIRWAQDGVSSGPEGYVDQDWLPTEAFQQRLVLDANNGLEGQLDSANGADEEKLDNAMPIKIPSNGSLQDRMSDKRKRKNSKTIASTNHADQPQTFPERLSVSPVVHVKPYESPFLSTDSKTELLRAMFDSMLDSRNFIQIVTCTIVVLGRYFPSLELPIGKNMMVHWQSTYLDLISRYELWNHHTEIIKLSTLRSIQNINTACVIHASCDVCKRRLPSSSPWICSKHCDADHKQAGLETGVKCALCQMVVKGLFAWCQGCGHGGHVDCIKQWFKYPMSKGQCPTGCGHICTQLR